MIKVKDPGTSEGANGKGKLIVIENVDLLE